MKRVLLILSLLANAILLAGVLRPGPGSSLDSSAGQNQTRAGGASVLVRTGETRTILIPAESEKHRWRHLEDTNYRTYIARLRAVECPEETIRDIIIALVNRDYSQRSRALQAANKKDFKFWEVRDHWQENQSQVWRQHRALEREKRALIKDLLGIDLQKENARLYGYPDWEERQWGFVPEDKREKLQLIQETFQDLEYELHRKYRGQWNEEMRADQKELRDKRRAELAQFLTPQELEEYELRYSQTAQQMSWETRHFKPSEQEYRNIFQARKAFDEEFYGYDLDPDDKALQERHRKAQQEMEKVLQTAMGERYEQYKRSKEYEYQELVKIADRAGLGREAADKVYDVKKLLEQEASKLRADASLTSAKRNETLKAMKVATEKELAEVLGEAGWGKYKKRHGWWLENVAR